MQLVINTFGASLRRKEELFEVRVGDRKVPVAARTISSVLIGTGAHFSSDCIDLALEQNIDVVLLDKFGQPKGRFWPAKMGSTAAIRRAQLLCAETPEGVEIVIGWTRTKLENARAFLGDLARKRPARSADFDEACTKIGEQVESLDQLNGSVDERRFEILGAEGAAATAYWQLIGTLPPRNFRFTGRSKHPAMDPFNAMLNYAYGVLYSMADRACIVAGLDPFVGILHTDNYNKRSLTFDLIEPFRIWADRVVLKLFTGRRCKEAMFHRGKNGVVLEKEAKELLLESLNEYLDQRIRYKCKSGKKIKTRQIKRRDSMQAEAHTFANRLLGKDGGLPEVLATEEIFADAEDE